VEDSGLLAGLSDAEMTASLQTLETMADRCSVMYFRLFVMQLVLVWESWHIREQRPFRQESGGE